MDTLILVIGWLFWFWGVSFSLVFIYCLVICLVSVWTDRVWISAGFIFTGIMFIMSNIMYYISWLILPIKDMIG